MEIARHPVTGYTIHIDMLRVRLDQAISATVVLDLTGADDAPGVKEGGVLEQITRELTIEALPTDIPDAIHHDVSTLVIGDTLTLEAITPPRGVTFLDDPETVVATLSPPRLQLEEEPGSRRRPSLSPRARPPMRPRRKPAKRPPARAKAGTRANSPRRPTSCRARHLSIG